ncbi:MAG: hypothetical protein JEZ05_01605 [Tenericutes bacterium]|nr:hypothetical protein [Mycoplasmatota bacterium]
MGKKLSNEEEIQQQISNINEKYSDKFNTLTTEYTKEILNLLKDVEEVQTAVDDPSKKPKDLNSIFDKIGSWLSTWNKNKK